MSNPLSHSRSENNDSNTCSACAWSPLWKVSLVMYWPSCGRQKRPFNGHCQVEINILVMVVVAETIGTSFQGERAQHSRVVTMGPSPCASCKRSANSSDLSKLCVIVEHQTVHHFANEVYRFRGPRSSSETTKRVSSGS